MRTDLFDLSGRLALVTGASRGIGLALARGLAEHGARVVVNGRDPERAATAAAALAGEGFEAHGVPFDVTDPDAVERAVAEVEARLGAIDVLVNNAGIQHRAPLEEFPPERWDALFDLNVRAVFLVAQAVARRMIPRGRGRIVNIASAQAELARPAIAPYAATKGAVRNLTRGMCADWARHGIAVNAIAPGYFRTELNRDLWSDPAFADWLAGRTPAGRWGELDELVGAAVFLASDAASFVNGHTLFVDGGITVTL